MLEINVLRGADQIGGSIIEVISEQAKIILDAGTELDETEDVVIPPIQGLFIGSSSYDAVLVSHYHQDHTGLLNYVVDGIPIYMTRQMNAIHKKISRRMGKSIKYEPIIIDENGQKLNGSYSFMIKDVRVTPYLCDHSAYDAHMYLLETANDSILYTGDYRSNGRKDFSEFLANLPNQVNKLISEGTVLSRKENIVNETEAELEERLFNLMHTDNPVFVLASTTNIDRIISVYNASHRTGRVLAIDAFQADLLEVIGGVPCPSSHSDIKVIQIGEPTQAHKELKHFSGHTIPRNILETKKFAMLIRSSIPMKKYLAGMKRETLKNATLVYSMWHGYLHEKRTKDYIDYCRQKGMKIAYVHTSGHADRQAIQAIIERVNPQELIPVHTENPETLVGMNRCRNGVEKVAGHPRKMCKSSYI